MHDTHVIQMVAGAASLGFSIALSSAIAARPGADDGPARRRIGRVMLAFLIAVGMSLATPSTWPGC